MSWKGGAGRLGLFLHPRCRRYAIKLLMLLSPLVPPFCAQFARVSAASLPSWSECPFTFTQRTSVPRSVVACISRLHTTITVAFLAHRALPGGLCAVHWSLVYWES